MATTFDFNTDDIIRNDSAKANSVNLAPSVAISDEFITIRGVFFSGSIVDAAGRFELSLKDSGGATVHTKEVNGLLGNGAADTIEYNLQLRAHPTNEGVLSETTVEGPSFITYTLIYEMSPTNYATAVAEMSWQGGQSPSGDVTIQSSTESGSMTSSKLQSGDRGRVHINIPFATVTV